MTRTRTIRAGALAALLLSLLSPCAPTLSQVGEVKTQVGEVKGSAVAAAASPSHASSSVNAQTGRVQNQKSVGQIDQKPFGQLPASFELNAGQADARVKFLSRGSRHTLLLGADGALLALRTGSEGRGAPWPCRADGYVGRLPPTHAATRPPSNSCA